MFILRKYLISSTEKWKHSLGIVCSKELLFWIICAAVSVCLVIFDVTDKKITEVASVTFISIAIYRTAHLLGTAYKYDNRHKKDHATMILQTVILFTVIGWLITVVCILDIKSDNFPAFGICATALAWIFQDAIKGVIAFYHLRMNGLLHIGDWIVLPKYNISGAITDITLTTVTVMSNDTTNSSIPTAILQSDSFENDQNMLDGKTPGRCMERQFLIDIDTICTFSNEQKNELIAKLKERGEDTIALEMENNETLNIHLFRMYIRHWLMNNEELSRHPRLVVSLQEPTPQGIPLRIHVFIIKTSLAPWENVRTQITEHILMSMEWFGLRLYQHATTDVNTFAKGGNV